MRLCFLGTQAKSLKGNPSSTNGSRTYVLPEVFFSGSPVVLFIMLYKVVLTFESVDEILKCDHPNESY